MHSRPMKTRLPAIGNTPQQWGNIMADRRKELGYTQQQLARLTGCSASYISDVENGKERAEVGKLLLLCGWLGLSIQISKAEDIPYAL